MKILLVNPNTMRNPPVIPIGLEYLVTALDNHGYEVDLLDLTFVSSSLTKLDETLRMNSYDIVGFSIRNIDSATYFTNEFYLPAIKKLVQCVKEHKKIVVLGGAGFSAMPHEVLTYLGADYGIVGSGEMMFPLFLETWKAGKLDKKIYAGQQHGPNKALVHRRGTKVDYSKYLTEGGIMGFETHRGCYNQCPYCVEAKTPVWYKNIPHIIEELRYIVNQGYTHFHLCDCEFNTDLNYSLEFCRALTESSLPLKWTLYMKPAPYNEELFQLLHQSHAYLITLTVDSDEQIQAQNNYSYKDLANFIEYCKKYKIKLAIDALTGYPNEPPKSTERMIHFFRKHRPTTVGISFYYRVYGNTPLAELIKQDESLQARLSRPLSKDETFLEPIFYHQHTREFVEKLIAEDELFNLAGLIPGVNYQRDD
ncbi:MAG: B12-binding domain-containing radical SAM protein [Candidatus Hermodarchaeota archaeon]